MILLYILISALQLVSFEAATTLSPEQRAQEIARLEKEKSELFQQLNAAIDDSVRSLRANNDSEAAVGISYIEDLREKMKLLNASSPSQDAGDRAQAQGAEILDTEEDFRRKSRGRGGAAAALRQLPVPPMKQSDVKFFDIRNVFGNRERNPKRWQERHDNRMIMQQKLEEWLAQREREKADIKRVMKEARDKEERCPRFGQMASKKKKRSRRNDADGGDGSDGKVSKGKKGSKEHLDKQDVRGVPGGSGKRYPCCRKCCKKSYLGCL